jgi:4-amino-4-deoxy-L-arabinose transferase-like glycosyltransferase
VLDKHNILLEIHNMKVMSMNERTRISMIVSISAAVLLGMTLLLLNADADVWSVIMLVIIVVLAAVALLLAMRARREMRSGFPVRDERSIALTMRAGNMAFYVSMYLFLFMAVVFVVLEDQGISLSNAELLFVVVAIMGSMQILFVTYYNRKARGLS